MDPNIDNPVLLPNWNKPVQTLHSEDFHLELVAHAYSGPPRSPKVCCWAQGYAQASWTHIESTEQLWAGALTQDVLKYKSHQTAEA